MTDFQAERLLVPKVSQWDHLQDPEFSVLLERFPARRSASVGIHFKMNHPLELRLARYSAIEAARGRPLIVYVTSTRNGVPGNMAADAVREMIDQIDAIPAGIRMVDILLHSSGGDGLTAWKLMSLLRGRFDTVGVLVPLSAFSAATMFALGADEIVMHPHASLGPIDPQVKTKGPNGEGFSYAYEDVSAFLRFLAEDAKLTEQPVLSPVIEKLFAKVDPVQIGGLKRMSDLSTDVGARLLEMHMKSKTAEELERTKGIAQSLNRSFLSHSDAISRERARGLGLKVAASDPVLEGLIWDAYLEIERYMELRIPFNPVSHFLASPAAAATLRPVAAVSVPPNAPPAVVNAIWQAVGQQAVQTAAATAAVEISYKHIHALMESKRISSEYISEGNVSCKKLSDGIQAEMIPIRSCWCSQVAVAAAPPAPTPVAPAQAAKGPQVAAGGKAVAAGAP